MTILRSGRRWYAECAGTVAAVVFSTDRNRWGWDVSGVSSFDLGAVTQLWDDGPSIGGVDEEIADGIVDFAAGDSVTNDLEGVVGNDPNASPYKITNYTASLTINGVDPKACCRR
jgi:hypothetical protein